MCRCFPGEALDALPVVGDLPSIEAFVDRGAMPVRVQLDVDAAARQLADLVRCHQMEDAPRAEVVEVEVDGSREIPQQRVLAVRGEGALLRMARQRLDEGLAARRGPQVQVSQAERQGRGRHDPSALLPQHVRARRTKNGEILFRVVRREIDRRRKSIALEHGERLPVEVVEAVVERDAHAARRQIARTKTLHGLAERQHGVATLLERPQALIEAERVDVIGRVPLVLVEPGHPVVAEDEQPVVAPRAGAHPGHHAQRLRGPQQRPLDRFHVLTKTYSLQPRPTRETRRPLLPSSCRRIAAFWPKAGARVASRVRDLRDRLFEWARRPGTPGADERHARPSRAGR